MKIGKIINTNRESVTSTLPILNTIFLSEKIMSTNTYTNPLDPFSKHKSDPLHEEVRQWLLDNPQDVPAPVVGNDYLDSASNWELATRANTGRKRPEHAAAMKIKTKEYWDSSAGMEKRKRLSERNKQVKSEQLKQAWKDGLYDNRIQNFKKSEETKKKMSEAAIRRWAK